MIMMSVLRKVQGKKNKKAKSGESMKTEGSKEKKERNFGVR